MIELRVSRESDINSLKELYKSCFEESDEALELFFKRIYKPEICYIVENCGELLSMLYLLDTSVNGRKAGYLYAAATKPEARGGGLMDGLINFAMATSGAELCVTLPASDELYGYYQKLGFKPLTANIARVTRCELERHAVDYNREDVFVNNYCGIRNRVLKNNFLFWNNNHINYAFDYNALYGAKIIKNNFGYLIAYEDNDVCEVSEIICDRHNAAYMFSDLLNITKADRFIFRLSPNQDYLPGEPERFAMAKYKTNYRPDDIYAGLTLE
ncbi:MAG: GNAT family N-acetyltransferase [Ruminococcus sp.]|nr:GNAT family N-acetyltransferase [Ruminococcus sp.]